MKALLSTLLTFVVLFVHAQSDKELTDLTVDKAQAKAHITFLASDELKGRDTPSEGQEIAAKYLATQLELYGVKTYSQYSNYQQLAKFKTLKAPESGAIVAGGETFRYATDFLKMSGDNFEWSGEFVLLKYATPEEIKNTEVRGRIIVAACGDGNDPSPRIWFSQSSDKRQAAKEAGAVGLIELYNSPQIPWSLLVQYLNGDRMMLDTDEENADLPSFWLLNDNQRASKIFDQSKSLQLKVEGPEPESFTAPNVVGYIEGTDSKLKNEYVVYCAHYDHVGIGQPNADGDSIYNGARDNAVGVVAVLEAARNLGKYPTKRSALFVFFTGEEKGLLGSQWFVDNSPLELNKMVFCNNVDGAGYNDVTKATVIGLERTTAMENIIAACKAYGLEAVQDPVPEQSLFDRSDNVSFAKKGVPAPDFGMGLTAFDAEIQKYYHQAADHVESLDMDYLHKFWRAYVLTGRMIANDKMKPEWIEGDKYYEAGVKLYGK